MIGCAKESREKEKGKINVGGSRGEQKERRNKMEGRVEKHTLSSGQDIERRETNTSTLFERKGGSFGTAMHAFPIYQTYDCLNSYNKATHNSSYYFKYLIRNDNAVFVLDIFKALTILTNAKHTLAKAGTYRER